MNSLRWRLQFIRYDFRGQLPKPYSKAANATQMLPTNMNDMNKEEPSRFVSNLFLFLLMIGCDASVDFIGWCVTTGLLLLGLNYFLTISFVEKLTVWQLKSILSEIVGCTLIDDKS